MVVAATFHKHNSVKSVIFSVFLLQFVKTEYAIVNIKHKTTDLLKNHIYFKNHAFRE